MDSTFRDDIRPWLRLTLSPGLTGAAQRSLLASFGTASAIFSASKVEVSRVVGEERASALARGPDEHLFASALAWLADPEHHIVVAGTAGYPPLLSQIHDPPVVLYALGCPELLQQPCLAIVGSRNATPQGLRDAHAFARALSDAGLCIVSGLALGVDAAAHRGGMAGRSASIAVLGTGPDVVYPRRNHDLAHHIAGSGCLITEFCPGTPSRAENFPRRNRLISGLALGVLVIEAAEKSGSLLTAHLAADQNRDVFALPGSIHSTHSKGCHKLIKAGAKLVERVEDVLAELGMTTSVEIATRHRSGSVGPVLSAMGFGPISLDEIVSRTGLDVASIASELSMLEIDGKIAALPGGKFQQLDGRRGAP